MDELGCVNIFLSEGAGVAEIVAEMEAAGQEVARDAFGHVKLDTINPGAWFGKQFADMLGAEKTHGAEERLLRPRGRRQRRRPAADQVAAPTWPSSAPCAREGGVIGHDEDRGDGLRAIEFPRIKGGKPFDIDAPWFGELLAGIGQPKGAKVEVEH